MVEIIYNAVSWIFFRPKP